MTIIIIIIIIIRLLSFTHVSAQVLQTVVRSTHQRNDTILVAPRSISHTRLTHTNGARLSAPWHLFVFRIFWTKACPITSSPKPATKWHTEMMDHLHLYMNLIRPVPRTVTIIIHIHQQTRTIYTKSQITHTQELSHTFQQ